MAAEISSLAPPQKGDWDWTVRAACRGVGTQHFYHPDAERGASKERRERRAKAICATCPVIWNCLSWALAVREPYGVWGGTSAEDREGMLTRQPA